MNKNDLIDIVAADTELSREQSDAALKSALGTIASALRVGESVTLNGFGTFLVRRRASRQSRNLKTGESTTLPEAVVPAFKPSKLLKELLK